MKQLLFLLLIISGVAFGQRGEFKVYENNLIYDPATMARLSTIVDSLNIRFRSCDMPHPYHSYPQGMATFVNIPSKAATALILEGVTPEGYVARFPIASHATTIWAMKTLAVDWEDNKIIEYAGLPYGWNSEPSLQVERTAANDKSTGWVISKDSKRAVFLHNFTNIELPYKYGRLVQYVDCLIDTTARIYFPSAEAAVYKMVEKGSKAESFIAWAEDFSGRPERPDFEKLDRIGNDFDSAFSLYVDRYHEWDSLRLVHLDEQMTKEVYWKGVLMEAVEEGMEKGNSDRRLEFYVSRYLTKADALNLMRSRKVIGNCSQDQSPRYHAMDICRLSAETAQWDIFLRSHLDIMNDRFERVTDGSYAWEGRKTYLKELEELDIAAVDLLLGTCLRVDDVSDNHYWGSIGRIGRALTDAGDKDDVETRLIDMVTCKELDPYNRLLAAYTMSHYVANLPEEDHRRISANAKLEVAVAGWPTYLREIWAKPER